MASVIPSVVTITATPAVISMSPQKDVEADPSYHRYLYRYLYRYLDRLSCTPFHD